MSHLALPHSPARVHFVGIGGIGMSGLARLLLARGYVVSGSDVSDSQLLDELKREGVSISLGHDDVSLARAADLVVRTAAVSDANPEVAEAIANGVQVIKRSELLGALSRDSRCLAVAGSHGKSTTSAMVTWALIVMGADPSYAIGAVLQSTGRNAGNGSGLAFVVEADEFDRSFLTLSPSHAVVTNIEFDHPDIFPVQDEYDDAFLTFMSQVDKEGSIIVSREDPGVQRLVPQMNERLRDNLVTIGDKEDADWTLTEREDGWNVSDPAGETIQLELTLPGRHNAMNATAAIALLAQEGHAPTEIAAALLSFQGLGRRFELKGESDGIVVIDDYAHHPTEIAATLEAARARFPGRRVWVVFQPHTYSRTRALAKDFSEALQAADAVMLMDVFASRELNDGSVTQHDLRAMAGSEGHRSGDNTDTVKRLVPLLEPNDVVLTLGAGNVTDLGPMLLTRLADRRPQPIQ